MERQVRRDMGFPQNEDYDSCSDYDDDEEDDEDAEYDRNVSASRPSDLPQAGPLVCP